MTARSYAMLPALLLVGSMATLQAGGAKDATAGARETIEDLQGELENVTGVEWK